MGNCSSSRLIGTLGLALATVLAFGCGSKDKKGDTTPTEGGDRDVTQVPKVDATLCDTKGKKVETFDLNRDNRPDVWKLSMKIEEGEVSRYILTCKQVDLDHDGEKDYVVAYNRTGAREFEKFDFDFDGRFDAFSIYDVKSGAVVETQRDSDFDGKYDLREIYDEKGLVTSIRRDLNADGDPDVWEQYVDGALVAILHDEDFDGKVDRREEIKSEVDRRSKSAADDLARDEEQNAEDAADEDKKTPPK